MAAVLVKRSIPSLNALTQPIWCCGLDSGWLSMLLHILHPVMPFALRLWQAKGAVRETAPCVSSCAISCNSHKINGELACRLCLVNCDSKRCEVPKALHLMRFINLSHACTCLACWLDSKVETWVVNIFIDLLGVCSRCHPVVMLGAWHSGQGSIFTYSKFGEREFKSRQSRAFITSTFFFLFIVWSFFCLLLVSLYFHCWSFKASQGFCDNIFLVNIEWGMMQDLCKMYSPAMADSITVELSTIKQTLWGYWQVATWWRLAPQ